MMDPAVLRQQIQSVLMRINAYSIDAEELLMATCAQESLLGAYRHQVNGPALGIFQMEPGDHDDIWKNYLAYKPALAALVKSLFLVGVNNTPLAYALETNDPYAIAMCRIHYERCPRALPRATDLNGMWMYYKVNYNSVHGAATREQFYRNYKLTNGSAV